LSNAILLVFVGLDNMRESKFYFTIFSKGYDKDWQDRVMFFEKAPTITIVLAAAQACSWR
jgi:hypothetical protein